MQKPSILAIACACFLASCSPRDFLTRRLAADLIAASPVFRAPRQFQLRTGVMSNKDYLSPNYLDLQHHGWISATTVRCPSDIAATPCSDVVLTPAGVETFQSLIAPRDSEKQAFSIPVLRRDLISIAAISKNGGSADVEFSWRWTPVNEVGAALYPNASETSYTATVVFRRFDDGWRVVESHSNIGGPLDEALRSVEESH